MIANLDDLIRKKQTYLNILYLLVSFPLSLIYFVFLITGIVVGICTSIIWIGIPILLLTMSCWWYMGIFERAYTMSWLHIQIPVMSLPVEKKKTLWLRIREQLSNRMTWKTVTYLLLKFPFGIVSFILALNIPLLILLLNVITFSISLLVTPFLFLLVKANGRALNLRALFWGFILFLLFSSDVVVIITCIYLVLILDDISFRLLIFLTIIIFTLIISLLFRVVISTSKKAKVQHLSVQTTTMRQVFVLTATGYGLTLTPLYLLNGLAWLWGQFAYTMLGMSNNAIRASEAEMRAVQERVKAELADQSRRELIVNVSHELRTPVASIRGHIEALLISYDEQDIQQAPSPPQSFRKYLTIVHNEATRLSTLIDDLLSLARAEANELHLNITATHVTAIIEEVYQTLMPLAQRERQITLIRTITPGLPPVMADHQRLLQVLLNLVRNAITYTLDGGIVSISLAQEDCNHLVLSVADTGIGIPPEELPHIFERFYRTDSSRARSSGGFGIGLAIVHDFVLAMGGSVTVESKVGEGSCFHVHLQTP